MICEFASFQMSLFASYLFRASPFGFVKVSFKLLNVVCFVIKITYSQAVATVQILNPLWIVLPIAPWQR